MSVVGARKCGGQKDVERESVLGREMRKGDRTGKQNEMDRDRHERGKGREKEREITIEREGARATDANEQRAPSRLSSRYIGRERDTKTPETLMPGRRPEMSID